MTQMSLRLSQGEKEHLQKYCELTERNQTEVLREFVRRLSIPGGSMPRELTAYPSPPYRGMGNSGEFG